MNVLGGLSQAIDCQALFYFLGASLCIFLIAVTYIYITSTLKGQVRKVFGGLVIVLLSASLYSIIQKGQVFINCVAGILVGSFVAIALFNEPRINMLDFVYNISNYFANSLWNENFIESMKATARKNLEKRL